MRVIEMIGYVEMIGGHEAQSLRVSSTHSHHHLVAALKGLQLHAPSGDLGEAPDLSAQKRDRCYEPFGLGCLMSSLCHVEMSSASSKRHTVAKY